jgi:hypothetical protein
MALSQTGGTSPLAAAISRFFTNTYLRLAPVFGITIPPDFIPPPKHVSALPRREVYPEHEGAGPCIPVDFPFPTSLSAAEREQWESLASRLR